MANNDKTAQVIEPASELDDLDSLANQVDNDHLEVTSDGTPLADVPAPVNYKTEATKGVDIFSSLITGYCPPTAELWTADKKEAVSDALAPVLEKYKISVGLDKLPCELVLIIVAGPLLYQTSKMVAAQMKREQDAAKQAKQPNQGNQVNQVKAPADPAAPESPEVLRHPQTELYKS